MAACGRKKQSGVWQFFIYDTNLNKSRCTCTLKANTADKECKALLTGKNASNLKAHLFSFHPDEHKQVLMQDEDELNNKKQRLEKESQVCMTKNNTAGQQTIEKCLANKVHSYAISSPEYEARTEALINMIIDGCHPITMSSQTAFRDFCQKMDPKYKIPGMTDNQ